MSQDPEIINPEELSHILETEDLSKLKDEYLNLPFDEIGIGDYIIKDVVAIISLEHNYTLVGIGFFDKFSNIIWNKKENQIKLYK